MDYYQLLARLRDWVCSVGPALRENARQAGRSAGLDMCISKLDALGSRSSYGHVIRTGQSEAFTLPAREEMILKFEVEDDLWRIDV